MVVQRRFAAAIVSRSASDVFWVEVGRVQRRRRGGLHTVGVLLLGAWGRGVAARNGARAWCQGCGDPAVVREAGVGWLFDGKARVDVFVVVFGVLPLVA